LNGTLRSRAFSERVSAKLKSAVRAIETEGPEVDFKAFVDVSIVSDIGGEATRALLAAAGAGNVMPMWPRQMSKSAESTAPLPLPSAPENLVTVVPCHFRQKT
jgi:hypothetical protein